jgi:hypothetical protein
MPEPWKLLTISPHDAVSTGAGSEICQNWLADASRFLSEHDTTMRMVTSDVGRRAQGGVASYEIV